MPCWRGRRCPGPADRRDHRGGLGDAADRLEALRRTGVRVADDLGTDRSSLTLLQDLPVVRAAHRRGRHGSLPSAVIALARAVGLDGVEFPEQAAH